MLEQLLSRNGYLLADGATATNLFDLGLEVGTAPETWLDLHPERIVALHRQFIVAGADIILTNTFGCNRQRLLQSNLQHDVKRLNRHAVTLAKAAAADAGRPIVIAGAIGPTGLSPGDHLTPADDAAEADCEAVFREQIMGLKEGGADLVWIETMSAVAELAAAARAAQTCGMPYVITASFHAADRTIVGHTAGTLGSLLATLTPPPFAFGANCGVGLADGVAAILAMTAAVPDAVVIAKANCGLPRLEGGRFVYAASANAIHNYARLARDAGARIIGGCCGTTPAHIAAMRRALDGYTPNARPSRAAVFAALG